MSTQVPCCQRRGRDRWHYVRATSGGLTLSRKVGRRSSTAPLGYSVRHLTAHAAATWPTLSATDRALWDQAARVLTTRSRFGPGPAMSGRQAYMAAWLHQAGLTAPSAPAAPSMTLAVSPVTGVYEIDEGKLTLTALSRALLSLEYCLFRVHGALPAYRSYRDRSIHGYNTVLATQGLNALPAYAFINSDPNHYAYRGTLGYSAATWTIEMWARDDGLESPDQTVAFNHSSPFLSFLMNFHGVLRVNWVAGGYDQGPRCSLGVWHYLALTMDNATSTMKVYVDGAQAGPSRSVAAAGLPLSFQIGGYSTLSIGVGGRFGECRISTVARSAAEIAAIWNAGAPLRFTVDANTSSYWPCRTVSGGTTPDLGPANKPMTVNLLGFAPGPFCRDLYRPADSPYATPRNVPVVLQPLHPSWMIAHPVKETVVW